MPEISRIYGIVIAMYYDDHPPPHFHVRYGVQRAILSIDTLGVIEGRLSARTTGMVVEWAALHRPESRANWTRAERHGPLQRIAPLE